MFNWLIPKKAARPQPKPNGHQDPDVIEQVVRERAAQVEQARKDLGLEYCDDVLHGRVLPPMYPNPKAH